MATRASYDVVVVGGGPAGLSAALVLGRCCRSVLLCDGNQPRNARSTAVHGFLTRDGTAPAELRRLAREQLARYENVDVLDIMVSDARREGSRFHVSLGDGSRVTASKLLLTTGVSDVMPAVPGVAELWGRGVFPCPYCDGWEVRNQRLAAYGCGSKGLALCRALTTWSSDIYLFCDGPCQLSSSDRRRLIDRQIVIREERVLGVEARDERLWRVVLDGGDAIERDALFVSAAQEQQSPLAQRLGCVIRRGVVETNEWQSTELGGLYVAGDASHDVQLAIVAAAEGAKAAFDINRALVRDAFDDVRMRGGAELPTPPR